MTDREAAAKMKALARMFPSMRNALGIAPWHPLHLETWAKDPNSHDEIVTARFLLSVWDPQQAWELQRFDVMEALRFWDAPHREAFLA